MADRYHYHRLPVQTGDVYENSSRPQLPNFDHFVRGAGHPGLAQRGTGQQEVIIDSPTPSGHPSLPTPPSTTASTSRGFWDGGLQQQSWSSDHSVHRADSHASIASIAESQRRASLALPIQPKSQPRPVRAYSSTNSDYSHSYREFSIGHIQHGQVIYEENASHHRQRLPLPPPHYTHDRGEPGLPTNEVAVEATGSVWGVTKAGKPRKRLSQACSTCREKKIKCDPGYGAKCSQCLRFNRECRFGTNPRQGHKDSKFLASAHSPGAKHTSSLVTRPPSRRSSIALSDVSTSNPTDTILRASSRSSTSADEALFLSPTMSDRQTSGAPTPSKRQRVCVDSPDRLGDSGNGHHQHLGQYELSRRNVNAHTYHLGFSADVDPICADEKLTKHYLEAFMEFINIPTFEIFPRDHMLQWAYKDERKTMQDRIVVYSMMALATIHSNDKHRTSHRALFKSIVYEQLDQMECNYSIQVAHTLLFLGFIEFADAQMQKGFSILVRMIGCVAFLRMNLELDAAPLTTAYGMSPSMFVECRRRTYWATYATDTYAAMSKGDPRLMRKDDVYLRLPCASQFYEADKIPKLPIFDQESVLSDVPPSKVLVQMADMVHLVHIATICSEVEINAWRCRNATKVGLPHPQDRSIRQRLESQLSIWAKTYNAALRAKESSTDNSDHYITSKDTSARAKRYAGLDILFHYAHMELNRRIYVQPLTKDEMLQHARVANLHAIETLKLIQQLLKQGGSETKDYFFATRGPLGGYAVHTAIDIITAAGSISDILAPQSSVMTLLWGGLEILEKLSEWWASAHIQHLQAKERVTTVFSMCQNALYDHKTYFYCPEPMNPGIDKEFDMIYGMDRAQYLRAAYELGAEIKEQDVFEIDTKRKESKHAGT